MFEFAITICFTNISIFSLWYSFKNNFLNTASYDQSEEALDIDKKIRGRFTTTSYLGTHCDINKKEYQNSLLTTAGAGQRLRAQQVEPTPNREQRANLFALCRGAKEEEQI